MTPAPRVLIVDDEQSVPRLAERDLKVLYITGSIETEPEPVERPARVVRSHAASVSLPEAMWQRHEYAVAPAFTQLDLWTEEALEQLCADVFGKHESPALAPTMCLEPVARPRR